MKKSFISRYFENKSGEALRKTITPDWRTTEGHLKLLNIPRNINSVLEVGCGIGRLLKELNKDIPVCVGIDASKDMIREGLEYCANTNIKLYKCDGEGDIPIDMNTKFDCAFSIITFQHIPNTDTVKKYITGMYERLNTNGILKFQVLKNDEFPEKDLWSFHPIDILNEHLQKIGAQNINIEETHRWVFFTCEK